jgi:4-hydroxymandelate synthase
VQHLAFQVADIVTAVTEFRAAGVEFLQTPDTYYDMLMTRLADLHEEIASLRGVGVLADRDEWGYLFQIFSRSPYERSTMFYELIQRRGARGFGSSNIRALYEAVDLTGRLAAG